VVVQQHEESVPKNDNVGFFVDLSARNSGSLLSPDRSDSA
jgi:hypothetical protein